MILEFRAHFEARVADVALMGPILAVILEVRAHAAARRVRLATQRTLKLLNTCVERTGRVLRWVKEWVCMEKGWVVDDRLGVGKMVGHRGVAMGKRVGYNKIAGY